MYVYIHDDFLCINFAINFTSCTEYIRWDHFLIFSMRLLIVKLLIFNSNTISVN
jgi:hypothetical protein